ncbi:hypothetical protein ABEB36_006661 [Hypothenemus hampei]
MERHPFFMKEAPKPGDTLHPLYEGLQKLKYDPDENEPSELAISYKDDGNFNFKHKNYRLAIVSYTEGIKQKCGDPDIESNLLNNRSAAHWFLKNYRSCLRDCELALKIKPNYEKVLNRAANCCYYLKQYAQAIEYCDKILEINETAKDVSVLRQKCLNEMKLKDRNERKKEIAEKKKQHSESILIKEIISRGYRIAEKVGNENLDLSKLEPCFPELVQNRVHLDEEQNCLVWPVAFVYPEYRIMDYIQEFRDSDCMLDHLNVVFKTNPDWDVKRKYTPDNLNIYFESDKQKLIRINVNDSLEAILKKPEYVIKGGTPSFIVLVKDSDVEKTLIKSI